MCFFCNCLFSSTFCSDLSLCSCLSAFNFLGSRSSKRPGGGRVGCQRHSDSWEAGHSSFRSEASTLLPPQTLCHSGSFCPCCFHTFRNSQALTSKMRHTWHHCVSTHTIWTNIPLSYRHLRATFSEGYLCTVSSHLLLFCLFIHFISLLLQL